MVKMRKLLLLLLFIFTPVFAGKDITEVNLKDVEWKYKGLKSGVHTYRQKDPDGRLVAVRGTAVINAPLELVLTILVNGTFEKQKKWVPNLQEFTVLKKESMLDRSLYVHVALNWPVRDRDFSYTSTITKTPNKKEVIVQYISNDTLAAKKEGVVRGAMKTMFILTRLSPNKTKVDLRAIADPRGAIPRFAINIAQRDYSEGMLSRIKQQVKDESATTEVHPEFVDILTE